jgi:hypothetical protein
MLVFWLIVLVIGALLVGGAVQKRAPRLRRIAGGLLASYVTTLLILAGTEAYFRFVFAQSSNIIDFATLNWLDRHWHTNSWGFRDREWQAPDYAGKQTVVVLGDSFGAGWGLPDTADRFSDVLGQKLGDGYAVMNAAVYGTSTPEQLDILKKFPVQKPDVVILQYFLNDINYAGLQLGLLPSPTPTPDWVNQTYFGNFLYWRIGVQSSPNAGMFNDWWQWSYDAYDNVGIWSVHQQEIEDFMAYTDSIGARLSVVVFPNLIDIVKSIPYVDRVAQVFEVSGHTDVLKLFDAAAAWDQADLMVSRRDSHASANFNHYVGEQLYERYFAPAS